MTILHDCSVLAMDKTSFLLACRLAAQDRAKQGIGTVSEKSVHAALKRYVDPDESHHEITVGHFVADVCNENGFFEIQTRCFGRLKEKIQAFLAIDSVTVLYPVSAKKWIIWRDEDGSEEPARLAPRKPTAASILPELYQMKALLREPNLRFCVLLLEEEEYRLKDGYGAEKKRKATKFDRYPIDLLDEIWLTEPSDYRQLVPKTLSDGFTAKDYARAVHLPVKKGTAAMNILFEMGAVERIGRENKAYLYRRAED